MADGDAKPWAPDPQNWNADQYEKARSIVATPGERSPDKIALLKSATDWYAKNMMDEPPGNAPLDPVPTAAPPEAVPHETEFPVQQIEGEIPHDVGGWTGFAQAMAKPVDAQAYDWGQATRSAATGASFGQNRRATAAGAELASAFGPSDPAGYERNYAAGSEGEDVANSEKQANDHAAQEHPGMHAAGSMLPAIATSQVQGPAALMNLIGRGAIARGAINAGTAYTLGGLQNVGESDAKTLDEAAQQFHEGGQAPAEIAGGLTAAFGTGGKLLSLAGEYAPGASRYLRGVAAGVGDLPEAQREALIAKVGDKPEQAVGAQIERMGLTKASPLPMTGKGYARAAGAAAEPLGDELGAILDRNAALGVEMPKADTIDQLRSLQTKFARTAGDEAKTQARTVQRAIKDLESNPGYADKQNLTVRDLQDLKKVYEGQGGFKPGEAPSPPVTAAKKAASRDIATKFRGGLGDTMRSMALREDVPRFNELRGDIGSLQTIRGVGLGTEGRTDLAGSVARGLHDPIGAFAHGVRDYGADVAATGVKGAGYGARAMGVLDTAAADPVYRASPAGGLLLLGQTRGANRGLPRPDMSAPPPALPPPPMPEPPQAPAQSQQPQDDTKGHEQIGRIKQRLQAAPATFGKYATELTQALGSENPDDELATVVHRLAATDPQFRMHYMRGAQ